MAVFLITLQSEPSDAMAQAIREHYGDDNSLRISDLAWFVDDKEAIVPQSVTHRLLDGNPDQSNPYGPYIVSTVNSYWGYHSNQTWEWLKVRGF